jgi:hypothetical protein
LVRHERIHNNTTQEGAMSPHTPRRLHSLALLSFAVLAVTACGGGGSGGEAPPPPQPQGPISISGTVLGGAGATVCLDTNADGICNAGEAATTASASGAFTLSVPAAAGGVAVVAQVPAGASGASYVLKAPASKAAVVSPITSVVQAGVDQGLALQAAELATALQLQVGAANLYTDYIAGPATADTEALAAIGTATIEGLRLGMPLSVAPTPNSSPDYSVYHFGYTDAQNYSLRRDYQMSTAPDLDSGRYIFYSLADGLLDGEPRPNVSAGPWASTSTGWTTFLNQANAHFSTTGNPSVRTRGNGYRELVTHIDIDVSGLNIADVVRQVRDPAVNSEVTIFGVNADALTGRMPAGAMIRRMRTTTVDVPLIHYTDQSAAVATGGATLAGLVAQGAVSLGQAHAPDLCTPNAAGVCPAESLRAGFGPGNTVNYQLCDWDDFFLHPLTNCVAAGSGTYSIGMAADNSTPVMSFTGLPASTTVNVATRKLVQRSDGIYIGWRQPTPSPQRTTRLNRVAFEALAGALALPAPASGAVPSPYFGMWRATYAGLESGSCNAVLIDALGRLLSGYCFSDDAARNFRLTGTVSDAGAASFSSTSADTFTGNFLTATASGTWHLSGAGAAGVWAATRY